jgi:hypothetical protein
MSRAKCALPTARRQGANFLFLLGGGLGSSRTGAVEKLKIDVYGLNLDGVLDSPILDPCSDCSPAIPPELSVTPVDLYDVSEPSCLQGVIQAERQSCCMIGEEDIQYRTDKPSSTFSPPTHPLLLVDLGYSSMSSRKVSIYGV